MSDILSFFRSRYRFVGGQPEFEDPDLSFIFNQINQDQDQFDHCVCSLRTDRTQNFQPIFSSLISGNEVSFVINDQTSIGS